MDLHMPKMNGIDATKAIFDIYQAYNSNPSLKIHRDVPIVVGMTAEDTDSVKVEWGKAGA